ncbi:hypothetical protein RBWH47_01052 [Rhodopirellula baltica WH47]|uniref:Uncharacterized protein n=1 Tax=Rhodopirellula baltica WH47 TaxID=991778 RepID=F2ANT7_RHOBT|nr:hypothetical protein RBWH47_01052 [Rhodopirellula baltica WH47]
MRAVATETTMERRSLKRCRSRYFCKRQLALAMKCFAVNQDRGLSAGICSRIETVTGQSKSLPGHGASPFPLGSIGCKQPVWILALQGTQI